MPYDSLKNINPALKGIDPPITLGQANEIAKEADAIEKDGKNGWAISIANFKKRHEIVDGHWVKKIKNGYSLWGETKKELNNIYLWDGEHE
jgi:hypothetical protein